MPRNAPRGIYAGPAHALLLFDEHRGGAYGYDPTCESRPEDDMFTTVRIYSGMPGVGARFLERKADIERVMRNVPGFAGYRLLSTPDGIASVTICETQDGCDASATAAAAWIRENMPDLSPKPPQIISGESLISFGAKPAR